MILDVLDDYKRIIPNVEYMIKDLNDKNVEIKVYEWNCDNKRYNKIQNSEIVSPPRYIDSPKIIFEYGEGKRLKK